MGRRQRAARAATPPPPTDDEELDLEAFSLSLEPVGLAIRDVSNDGNCFFRAVSDQLYGNEDYHMKLRERTCDYLAQHKAHYRFFVDDEQSFDEYVAEMRSDGIWADNLELQAVSMVFEVNIRVHQSGKPSYDIRNHPSKHAKAIHLSYHFGEHYASVRPLRTMELKVPAQHEPLPISGSSSAQQDDREVEETSRRPRQPAKANEDSIDAAWKRAERGYKDLSALVDKTRKAVRAIRTAEVSSGDTGERRDAAKRVELGMKDARMNLRDVQDAIVEGKSAHRFRSKKIMHERRDKKSASIGFSDSDETSYSEEDDEEEELYKVGVRHKTELIFVRLNEIESTVIAALEDVKSISSDNSAESTSASKYLRGGKRREQETKRREKKERRRREQEKMAKGEPLLIYAPHSSRSRNSDIAI